MIHHHRLKAFERILYVAYRLPRINLLNLRASLYFADLMSVAMIGRMIAQDTYLGLLSGPLPLSLFIGLRENLLAGYIEVETNSVVAKRSPQENLFSKSDLIYLNKSILLYGKRTVHHLKYDFSQDKTFVHCGDLPDCEFGLSEIAEVLDLTGNLIAYVKGNSR
jgi:hypothetical protein